MHGRTWIQEVFLKAQSVSLWQILPIARSQCIAQDDNWLDNQLFIDVKLKSWLFSWAVHALDARVLSFECDPRWSGLQLICTSQQVGLGSVGGQK